MLIKYIGGRSRYEVSLNRKPVYFTPENNKTVDVQDKAMINYIFSLPNRAEFEVVDVSVQVSVPKPQEVKQEEKRKQEKTFVEIFKNKPGRPKKEKN